MKKTVEVIEYPERAKVLVDPMRREIVRLLAEGEKTQSELAKLFGLSDPSVGHHLNLLRECALIRIARKEVEEHGILQKFYESTAYVFLVDSRKMPVEIERYFMPIALERARGIIALLSVMSNTPIVLSADQLEVFAKLVASTIIDVAKKFTRPWSGTREELLAKIYRDVLYKLVKKPEHLPDVAKPYFARIDRS
jgi:DNA-binding transcriptional ArsR family regulator